MRLGMIGLGRIGAFHATTLSGLTQVESSSSTTQCPH